MFIFRRNLNIFPIAQEPDYMDQDVWIELDRMYVFRGENVEVALNSSESETPVYVFDPLGECIYNQTWSGNETRSLPVADNATFGDYLFMANLTSCRVKKYVTVVNTEDFEPVSFPFSKTHRELDYQVFSNKTLVAGGLSFSIPELPDAVEINCWNNSDIFVARFQVPAQGITVDLNLIFCYYGAKLMINGTSDGLKDWSFQFYSPQKIKQGFDRIELAKPNCFGFSYGSLFFDWSDFRRAGEHFSYNHTSHVLTVYNIPETFRLDPSIGRTQTGAAEGWFGGYQILEGYDGVIWQALDGNGTANNITSIIDAPNPSGANVSFALYDNNSPNENLLGYTEQTFLSQGDDYTVTLDFTGTPPSIVNGTYYRISLWGSGTSGNIEYHYDLTAGGGQQHEYNASTYNWPNFEDPYVRTGATNRNVTVWLNYTVSIGNTPTYYGDIPLSFTVASEKIFIFFREGSIPLTFAFNGLFSYEIIRNWFGEIPLSFTFLSERATSFLRQGTIPLTFTLESLATIGAFYNFYGSIPLAFQVLSETAFSFTKYGSIPLTFTLDGVAEIVIPGVLNLFGSIPLQFIINSVSTVTAPTTISQVLALAAIAFIIAIVAVAIALTKKD